jgi:hypothetical protein
MSQRFSYIRYDEKSVEKQEKFKKLFEEIEVFAEEVLENSREKSLLLTGLEEAYLWTGKAIRNEQIKRNSLEDHVSERG